jgi:DNA-binding XRE family transcriptional regulator
VRLRTEVFDSLTAARGATTDRSRAALFDVVHTTIGRLRRGEVEAELALAMRMARTLGVEVETLFAESAKAA